MYLSYNEYIEYGGTLDETTFNDYCFEAEAQINWYTFNRLEKMAPENINEKVKRCVYLLIQKIEAVQAYQQPIGANGEANAINAGIASQSNDGVSISYNVLSASDAVNLAKDEIKRTINIYLQGVTNELGQKVLYRGLYPNE